MNDERIRCLWACQSEPEKHYHDSEWGVPLRDEQGLFEFLILEGAQAGLSWSTILNKRENYRKAFDRFDAEKIARYSDRRVEKLLVNPGIVRNRLKVNAAVTNARAWLDLREREGDMAAWLWQFVDGEPVQNSWRDHADVPVNTPQSDAMSKALKDAGFKFVGSTICYAFMQATGMVNDHTTDCFRWAELASQAG
jgi:DNA-3-methyladenine glycosylase I